MDGQRITRPPVFLSASLPLPGRAPYDEDVQRSRIREAILGLLTACCNAELHLVFGGHPAISPLVHHASEVLGNIEDITIFQSEYFKENLPEIALRFPGLTFAHATGNREADKYPSINAMRTEMIEKFPVPYIAGFFMGGMKGIVDEFSRFGEFHAHAPRFPITSTGGATRIHRLGAELRNDELSDDQLHLIHLDAEQPGGMTYRTLFSRLLGTLAAR